MWATECHTTIFCVFDTPLLLCCDWYLERAHDSFLIQSGLINYSPIPWLRPWDIPTNETKITQRLPEAIKADIQNHAALCFPGTKFTVGLCRAMLSLLSILPITGPQHYRFLDSSFYNFTQGYGPDVHIEVGFHMYGYPEPALCRVLN